MSTVQFTLSSLIDILGLVQSILLGLILISNGKENRATWLLGLVVITYGLELHEAISDEIGLYEQLPQLLFLPFNFYYLTLPLLYLYTKSLLGPIKLREHWKDLWPGILEFVIYLVLFLLPVATKLHLWESNNFQLFYELVEMGSLFFSIWYAYRVIRLVNRHQREVLDFYSSTSGKLLGWVKLVAWFIIAFYTLWIPFLFLPEDFSRNIGIPIMGVLNVMFIFWLALSGFKQSIVFKPETEKPFAKPENPQQVPVAAVNTFDLICDFLEKEKPFTNPQLNLAELSRQLGIPQRTVSETINSKGGMNFNQFINQYRVEEAKRLMADPEFAHLNLLGIGFEVGFNSKTSFYTTFKNMAGMTPSKFQKQSVSA